MLCGDPHLQINQLPSVFLEVSARVGDDYWLGASIPGLPGIAVGRNQNLAWSGTFSCADNIELGTQEYIVEIKRRFKKNLRISVLSSHWAGDKKAGASLASFMRLPLCASSAEAHRVLQNATTFALHFVLADRNDDVRYQQIGCVPHCDLPEFAAQDGIIASANEGRLSKEGKTIAPFAQPHYRLQRIEQFLKASKHHDIASMQRLQTDLLSLQSKILLPRILHHLEPSLFRSTLQSWDCIYDKESLGAHAFSIVYQNLLRSLHCELGGPWFLQMLEHSELSVWWCKALDKILLAPWEGERGARFVQAINASAEFTVCPWGKVQTFSMPHMVLGSVFGKKTMPLAGSIATVCQGNVFKLGNKPMAVGPAYRMICDFSEDAIYSSLPGGVDGSGFSPSYTRWLADWHSGHYHRLCRP
jgi:penicillin amidase